MARALSDDQVRQLRQRAQQLDAQPGCPAGGAGVAQAVQAVCGVQAQDGPSAALAVRARCAGLVAADVERARVDERLIVRTWCMRGTLHLVSAEDIGWLLGLFGPLFIRAGRGRRAALGLDEDTGARGIRALRDALAARGPLTRAEIVAHLAGHGIRLVGQTAPHLIGLAALQGVICYGPNRGREPTTVLLADWIKSGPALPPEQARAVLAQRYLSAYAPATPQDFAAWAGLPLGEARAAWQQLAGQLVEVTAGSAAAWMLKTQTRWLDRAAARHPSVKLLPGYDVYLLGYRNREIILAAQYAKRIHPGGGVLRPVLLVNGRAAGTWKIKRQRDRIDVIVEPFETLATDVLPWLDAEIENLAHFLSAHATLKMLPAR